MTITEQSAPLSPRQIAARKAWETMRAKKAARAEIETRKADIAAAAISTSPLADAAIVSMFVDDNRVGCGVRRFVVVEIGRNWVKLFHPGSLENARVARVDFDRHAKADAKRGDLGRVRAIIKRNVEQVQRLLPDECTRACARAKAALHALGSGR